MSKREKKDLINLMNCCGFDWICDLACENRRELVASKYIDSEDLWWRPLEMEGSGFARLFKDSVKAIFYERT